MTTGIIIVFLWAINFIGWAIERAVWKDDAIVFTVVFATILTALEFGAIKLIDYLISMF